MAALSPVYHPRKLTDSPLWKILHKHYPDFKTGYDEHCEKQYGFFRPVVDEVVEDYLRCGDSPKDLPGYAAPTKRGEIYLCQPLVRRQSKLWIQLNTSRNAAHLLAIWFCNQEVFGR
jgi:hypothetical protein